MNYSLEEQEKIMQAGKYSLIDFSIVTNPRYKPNWHHEEVAKKLEKVINGEITRLMIFMPPRSGKSQLATINFPAWILGNYPDKEIITISYSGELAQDFGSKTRDLVNGEWYQTIFQEVKLKEDEKAKGKWKTTQGGSYVSVGVGGAITGRGADILIIDDPIKNREEAESLVYREKVWNFYTSTAYTRLNPKGAIILILTRWHTDDLAGRLFEQQRLGGERWEIIEFPAIAEKDEKYRKQGQSLWENRYNLQTLEIIKKTIGIYNWVALYQQKPITSETQEFRQEWFKKRTRDEIIRLMTRNFITIDTAVSQKESADFTAIVRNYVDRENKWNISVMKGRYSPTELINIIFSLYERDRPEKIGIEKTTYTMAIKPFLEEEMRKRNIFLPIQELEHKQVQKETRIRGIIPRYESQSIFHIEGETLELEDELLQFPKGQHDDLPDALAYQLQIADPPQIFEPQATKPIEFYYPELGI